MPTVYEDATRKIEFMEKLRPVIPDRYVWHIKYNNLIQDISIAESGLVGGDVWYGFR